jgi:Zn-dependent protease
MILVTVLAIWIFSLCLHEFSHARVAYAGGDYTVKDKGYLTFNPFRYVHPVTSLLLPAVFLMMGWIALPGGAVWIETWRLRSRGWQSGVSLAGPAANLVCCIALGLPFLLGIYDHEADQDSAMWAIIAVSCYWQAVAFVLNLLPIPGLDGYGAIEPWLPREAREALARFKPYGFIILVVLFASSPGFNRTFGSWVVHILRILEVDGEAFARGWDGMRIFSR